MVAIVEGLIIQSLYRFLTAFVKEISFWLCCCNFFSVFYFLNAIQSDINGTAVYVLGYRIILDPSQTSF